MLCAINSFNPYTAQEIFLVNESVHFAGWQLQSVLQSHNVSSQKTTTGLRKNGVRSTTPKKLHQWHIFKDRNIIKMVAQFDSLHILSD